MGLQFFNPVLLLNLVEVVPALVTAEATLDRISAFTTDVLGRHVIVARDRAGFVVNSRLFPFIVSAIRMFASGLVEAAEVSEGMVRGCARPRSLLRLA